MIIGDGFHRERKRLICSVFAGHKRLGKVVQLTFHLCSMWQVAGQSHDSYNPIYMRAM